MATGGVETDQQPGPFEVLVGEAVLQRTLELGFELVGDLEGYGGGVVGHGTAPGLVGGDAKKGT